MNTIYGPTPSHGGTWRSYTKGNDAHVVPGFEGRRHELHLQCWCHPVYSNELTPDGDVIMHNVAQ